jgi:hypothetical protein
MWPGARNESTSTPVNRRRLTLRQAQLLECIHDLEEIVDTLRAKEEEEEEEGTETRCVPENKTLDDE